MAGNVNQLLKENEELRSRLVEAEEALSAIRNGEVDAIVVSGSVGQKIFSLSSAETPYRVLIENMGEGAVTLTDKGVILYCNPSFISLTGAAEEKITGGSIFSFIEKPDLKKFKALLNKVINKERRTGEFRMRGPINEVIYCRFAVSTLPADMTGDLFLIVSNITALKEYEHNLENERRKFEETLNIVPAYVIVSSSEDFTIRFANKYFREQFGEPGSGKCYEQIFGKTKRCAICSHSNEFSAENPNYIETTGPNGRIYHITSFPFTNANKESLILEMGVDVTEKKNLDKIILTKSFETEEREKKRMANDLHDDLGPTLSAIKLQLTMLTEGYPNEILNSCNEMLDDCIERMRFLASSISPNLVETYGLEKALLSFMNKIMKSDRIHFSFTSNLKDTRFRMEIEVQLYRIITELVNNTIKHVGPAKIMLDLKMNDEGIQVFYADNGPGYEVESKPTFASGSGLLNIKSRVSIINGKITFLNRDGHTEVVVYAGFPK
jgi:PAS domain S-box-containing protein